MSELTRAESGCATVEVEGDRGTCSCIYSGEGTVLIEVGLAVYELAERSNFPFEGSNLVLEVLVLFFELCNLTGEVFILLCGERNRNDCGSYAAVTLEALLSKLVLNAPGEGDRERCKS